jgi:shikimate dehydrogenase
MSKRTLIDGYSIELKKANTFYFIGVTTGKSSIREVFPRWMKALGRPEIVLEGVDHPPHDSPEAYRRSVAQIKYDPLSLGALVTTHKINVFEAASDMFDEIHESATLTGEISCISKREGRLIGHAKDPLTGGMSLDAILGMDYFDRTHGHVLCFGAGGVGKAVSLHLIQKEDSSDQPERVVIVNRSQPRLDQLKVMVEIVNSGIRFDYVCNDDQKINDEIIAALPDGSVVINATGMGKDRPGSPITDNGLLPRNGVAWEVNYRGALDFWHQAMAQQQSRNLTVVDGWQYFLHGWTQHIAEVLDITMDSVTFDELSGLASELRPNLTPQPRSGSKQK